MVKLESITILKAEELPDKVKLETGMYTGFVEVRVQRDSPPNPKAIKLIESPANKLREALLSVGLTANNI